MDPKVTFFSTPPMASIDPLSSPMISANGGTGLDQRGGVTSFQSVLTDAVAQVNQLQLDASTQQQAINAGQSDDLAAAMVASQKANISFTALLQVRNKLSNAVDDILNTPV